jgi:predicted nucleic acid-binding protein
MALKRTFGFPAAAIDALLSFIAQNGESRVGLLSLDAFVDEADRKFWEVASSGPAEALVTGNSNHFPKHTLVMAPSEFLDWFASKR